MTSKFIEETNKDFKEFVESESVSPPRHLQDKIFSHVHRELNPNAWILFSKIALIHFFVGLVTLSLCPQFGLRIFGEGLGIMNFFLHFGTYGCTALCGAFFVGSSVLVSGIILRPEDLKVLRHHRWLQISALTLISLGAFLIADVEIIFAFAFAWIIGSIFGGVVMLEIGQYLRPTFWTNS